MHTFKVCIYYFTTCKEWTCWRRVMGCFFLNETNCFCAQFVSVDDAYRIDSFSQSWMLRTVWESTQNKISTSLFLVCVHWQWLMTQRPDYQALIACYKTRRFWWNIAPIKSHIIIAIIINLTCFILSLVWKAVLHVHELLIGNHRGMGCTLQLS